MTSSRLAGGFGWMVPYIGYDPDTEAGPGRPIEYIPPMALPGEMAPVPGYEAADVFAAAAEWPAQLSREELERVYEMAGVPVEWREALARIAWCESRWSPGAVGDDGNSLGLHQLNRLWFEYAAEDPQQWADPVVNTRAALGAIRYDIAKGYSRYVQWTCQP